MVIRLCDGACVCCDKHDMRYAHDSTCHGFSRFCNKWHIGRRTFWFFFVVASTIILGISLHDRFSYFLLFEVKTEMGSHSHAKFPLPAVTICNMNMFTKSLLNSFDKEMLNISSSLLSWIVKAQQKTFFARVLPKNASNIYWQQVAKYEEIEQELMAQYNQQNFTVDQWIYEKGWQMNSSHPVLLECSVGTVRCSVADFKPVLTPQGLCYTINHQSEPKFWQMSPGSDSGYNIIIDINQYEYTFYKLDSGKQYECGAKTLIHNWYDNVYTGTNLAPYIGAPPGVVGYISAQTATYEIIHDHMWIHCEENSSIPQRNCLASCTAEETYEKCGCRLWFENSPYPVCGVARTTACLVFKETSLPWSRKSMLSDSKCQSKCYRACWEKKYKVGISYTLLTSNNTIDEFVQHLHQLTNYSVLHYTKNGSFSRYTHDYVKKNLIQFQIAYPDMVIVTSVTSPALSTSAFLSDLGGQLGLFAGISLVTIMELLEYPAMKLYSLLMMKKRRKHKQQESSAKLHKEPSTFSYENMGGDFETPRPSFDTAVISSQPPKYSDIGKSASPNFDNNAFIF